MHFGRDLSKKASVEVPDISPVLEKWQMNIKMFEISMYFLGEGKCFPILTDILNNTSAMNSAPRE